MVEAVSCVANGEVVGLISLMHNNDATFIGLNAYTNSNTKAQLRSEFDTTVQPVAYQTFLWTETGSVDGNVVSLAENNGKMLYMATSNEVLHTHHPFNGIRLQ